GGVPRGWTRPFQRPPRPAPVTDGGPNGVALMNHSSTAAALSAATVRLLRAEAGPPLETRRARQRPVGRIHPTDVHERSPLLADWDCCWCDGKPLHDTADWLAAVRAGRLAEVTGAFALAWRDPDGTLTLARDAIGERTLFYAPLADGVVFASAMRDILATGLVSRTLNLPAVAAYLSYAYLPGRETLVR